MSLNVKVSINAAAPMARLEKIKEVAADQETTGAVLAEALLKLTRQRIQDKYVPEDDPGITFWADVRNSAEAEVQGNVITVSLNELGVGLRYRGGDVTPGKSISSYTGKLTRALSVPTPKVPTLQGRYIRPGRAGLLAFIRAVTRGETIGYLVEGQQKTITRGKNKGKERVVPKPGGSLLYVLRSVTHHREDPGILPDEAAIQAAAQAALQLLIFD